jgi:hypothetical protein
MDLYHAEMDKLRKITEDLGCEVNFTTARAIAFNLNMVIYVSPLASIENIYAFAHEIGHLMDFREGNLDHRMWLNDPSYRITAEMRAWEKSYHILVNLGVPMESWMRHVKEKLGTYFDREPEVV